MFVINRSLWYKLVSVGELLIRLKVLLIFEVSILDELSFPIYLTTFVETSIELLLISFISILFWSNKLIFVFAYLLTNDDEISTKFNDDVLSCNTLVEENCFVEISSLILADTDDDVFDNITLLLS